MDKPQPISPTAVTSSRDLQQAMSEESAVQGAPVLSVHPGARRVSTCDTDVAGILCSRGQGFTPRPPCPRRAVGTGSRPSSGVITRHHCPPVPPSTGRTRSEPSRDHDSEHSSMDRVHTPSGVSLLCVRYTPFSDVAPTLVENMPRIADMTHM